MEDNKIVKTYFFNYGTLSIKKAQEKNREDAASFSSPWKMTLESASLIAAVAKVYNKLLLNCINPEIEKILGKNQNSFQRT